MDYRTTPDELMMTLALWDELIPGRARIHLIGCGGTALTLLGYKESTKDVDLLVPWVREYERLIRFLERAGYQRTTTFGWHRPGEGVIYDLYPGKRVYMTELLTSPLLRGANRKIRQWKKICLGVLNTVDLIISKLFRGTAADREDCLAVLRNETVDFAELEKRYRETARYDVSEARVLRNWSVFLDDLRKHGVPMGLHRRQRS